MYEHKSVCSVDIFEINNTLPKQETTYLVCSEDKVVTLGGRGVFFGPWNLMTVQEVDNDGGGLQQLISSVQQGRLESTVTLLCTWGCVWFFLI